MIDACRTRVKTKLSRFADCSPIGVISDTHGLLREQAQTALEDCGLILHAGDVGKQEVLSTLERIAPVVPVRGNVDKGAWASLLPEAAIIEIGTTNIYMLHDIAALDFDPASAGFDWVIFGHSHKPSCEDRSGVRYLNPGSAGPRRFKLPISLALLDLRHSPAVPEFVRL